MPPPRDVRGLAQYTVEWTTSISWYEIVTLAFL